MKIIFTKKLFPPFGEVKVPWTSEERVTFCGLFWAPSLEELRLRGWSIDSEVMDAMFAEFGRDIVPEKAIVYARVHPFEKLDFSDMLQDLTTQGRKYDMRRMPKPATNWRMKLAAFLRPIKPQPVSVEADREYVYHCFKHYGGRTLGPYVFLVCKSPLERWTELLKQTDRVGITLQLLEKVELAIVNHDDHGLEMMSMIRKPEWFLNAVQILASKIAIPVEIQETGNPWGDVGPFGYHIHRRYTGPSMMKPKSG